MGPTALCCRDSGTRGKPLLAEDLGRAKHVWSSRACAGSLSKQGCEQEKDGEETSSWGPVAGAGREQRCPVGHAWELCLGAGEQQALGHSTIYPATSLRRSPLSQARWVPKVKTKQGDWIS